MDGHSALLLNRDTLQITITGQGINPKDLRHIFEPFYSKKEKGTGLGLAIVKRIIEEHGGRTVTESQLTLGTTFKIILNSNDKY